MVETFFLDWGVSLWAGAVFGLVGRRAVAAAPPGFATRAFVLGMVYLNVGIVAVAAIFYTVNPAWMWMFTVDPGAIPIAVVALALGVYEGMFVAGFVLAPALERARRGAGLTLAVAIGALLTAAQVGARDRLLRLDIAETWLLIALLAVSGALLVVALVAVARADRARPAGIL